MAHPTMRIDGITSEDHTTIGFKCDCGSDFHFVIPATIFQDMANHLTEHNSVMGNLSWSLRGVVNGVDLFNFPLWFMSNPPDDRREALP